METEFTQLIMELREEMRQLKEELQDLRQQKVIKKTRKVEIESVTVAEAETLLNLSNSGVRKKMQTGELDFYKPPNGKTRILISSINNI